MADRINNTRQGESRRPHHSQPISSKKFATDRPPADEVIVALANAYENRRARQVTEWERLSPRVTV